MELLSGLAKYSLDTKENWELVNPILPLNVLSFATSIDGVKLKIGDGVHPWNSIPYFSDQPGVLSDLSTLGIVSRSLLGDLSIGTEDTKYITPALLLTHLRKKYNGDTFILAPASNIYRAVDAETYVNIFTYPPLRPYGSREPAEGGIVPDVAFRMEHKGSATVSFQARKGVGNTEIRVCKNLIPLQVWITSSSAYRTQTFNVDFIPGDLIAVQARQLSGSSNGRLRDVRILASEQIVVASSFTYFKSAK